MYGRLNETQRIMGSKTGDAITVESGCGEFWFGDPIYPIYIEM